VSVPEEEVCRAKSAHGSASIGTGGTEIESNAANQVARATRVRRLRGATLFVLLVGIVALVTWLEIDVGLTGTSIHDAAVHATDDIRSWGAMAVAASIGLMVMHGVVPAPAEIVVVANCMVFGPYWGFVVTWIGAMVAASVAFGLSRYLGRPFLRRVLSARSYTKIDQWIGRQGVPTLILCRLIPLVSFNVINYGAGAMSISWWTFIWTTAVGIVPGTIATVLVTESVLSGNTAMAVLCIIVACLFLVFWAWRRRKRADASGPR
jgi:uncharacterized membrane protein YdjX (TVP38/TMEM64 family)